MQFKIQAVLGVDGERYKSSGPKNDHLNAEECDYDEIETFKIDVDKLKMKNNSRNVAAIPGAPIPLLTQSILRTPTLSLRLF